MQQTLNHQAFDLGQHTNVGRREHNEDFHFVDRHLGLVVVADGVGGHAAGEVASRLTCEAVQREVSKGATLTEAILQANRDVANAVANGIGKPGMASTVVVARFTDGQFELAWVGDSRAYLWDDSLTLLTRDHSYVEAQLASGNITMEEARNHPRKNVILQAIGLHKDDDIEVGTNCGQLAAGSALLLCTDGVTDALDNEQLTRTLTRYSSASDICEALVDLSVAHGGTDNSTALMVVRSLANTRSTQKSSADSIVWAYEPTAGIYKNGANQVIDFARTEERGSTKQPRVLDPRPVHGTALESTSAPKSQTKHPSNHRGALLWIAVLLTAAAVAIARWIN